MLLLIEKANMLTGKETCPLCETGENVICVSIQKLPQNPDRTLLAQQLNQYDSLWGKLKDVQK